MKNPFKKIEPKPEKLFHEEYPEILEWIIGDTIIYCNSSAIYKGVGDKGEVILYKRITEKLDSYHIKSCKNESLKTRILEMKLKNSYNQYLLDVQQAIKELQYHEREKVI